MAIVGTGGIAKAHLAGLRQMGGRIDLVAAADADPSVAGAFCAANGIPRCYADAEELLAAEQPDLVHVCTPPVTHCELSILSLEAGAWVLCEKPPFGSLAQGDQIRAAEERTGRFCSSVFQWRFGSGAQHLKRLTETEAMGRPLLGVCQTTWYRDPSYYEAPWRGRWETELGGASMGQGIHAMDLFLWLLGDWQEVRADMGTLDRDMEVEDVSMALVRFQNGAMGSIVNSVVSPREESYLRFDFQRSTVELRHLYGYTNESWHYAVTPSTEHGDERARWQAIPDDFPSTHATQLAGLLDCMERHERPPVSGLETRRTMEFVASLYKSSLTGHPVSRGSIDSEDPFYYSMNGATDRKGGVP